jgi:exosortase
MEANARRLGDFSRLRPEARWAAWLALGLIVLVIADQLNYWGTEEDFSFGYLVPVFVAYVLNDRWPLLKAILIGDAGAPGAPALPEDALAGGLNFFASLVVCGSLLLFLYGGFLRAVTGPDTDSAVALGCGLGAFVLAMGFLVARTDAQGRAVTLSQRGRLVALLVFPALAWLISAPLMLLFGTRVKLVLLEWVVRIVSNLFNALGYEIVREGSVLVLPHGSVGVADACSGIRSLTACLFAGSFLAAVFMDRFWKKVLLLAMSAVLAFGMNIVRSMFLTGWAYTYNTDTFNAIDADFWRHPEYLQDAHGQPVLNALGHPALNPDFHFFTVHDFAGYLVLALTLAGLLLLLPILNFKLKLPEDPEEHPTSNIQHPTSNIVEPTPPVPNPPPADS